MKNTFGSALALTIFGESHGRAIGGVLDGMAAGVPVDEGFIAACMDKRRARGDGLSTPRVEADNVQLLSGVVNGHTTGTAIALIIENQNTRSGDYAKTADLLRPGHADYTAYAKYHGFQDARGGGAKLACDYANECIRNGKTDIALIEDRKNPAMIKQLRDGLSRAFKENGMEFSGYIEIPKEYRSSYLFLKEYVKTNPRKDVVITYRDSQAMAVLNVAKEEGVDIPNDMELVCILDSKYNSMARPQISGFKIPDYDLGAVAMRLLTKMLTDENDVVDKEIELSYIFTPRQSTK